MPRHSHTFRHVGGASLGALLVMAGMLGVSPALADEAAETRQQLEAVQKEIKEGESRAEEAEADIARLQEDYRTLQLRLIDAADRLRAIEDEVNDLEPRLAELEAQEKTASAELEVRADALARSLAAMQRLSRQPTEALILREANIRDSARTAILLDHVMPALREQASALNSQIKKVKGLRAEIEQERTALLTQQAELKAGREELDRLMAEKKERQHVLEAALEKERERLAGLAEEADDLADLLEKLEEKGSGTIREGFADIGRPLDGPPFSSARGQLPLPARGRIVRLFNETSPGEPPLRGIEVVTGAGAQVISPWDGKVIFAGPFRDYGLLLIISHGEGYHTLLAGLESIDAFVAQWVLAGEPVGRMRRGNAKGSAGGVDNGNPTLYIELRREGRSINPLPWLAVSDRKARS